MKCYYSPTKQVFISKNKADKEIWKRRSKGRLYVYKCPHCNYYHLTSKTQ